MTIDEIRALLNDLESDRVERTFSTFGLQGETELGIY